MLKYLYPKINWENIKAVGFDLDGTLYDESEFVYGAYTNIAKQLKLIYEIDETKLVEFLFQKWLIKGSSYSNIYKDVLPLFNIEPTKKILDICFETYRKIDFFDINLLERTKTILTEITKNFDCFIVTDGREKVQQNKINLLGLQKYFSKEKIFITGSFGIEYYKPSVKINNEIELLKAYNPSQIVFFGDRNIDEEYALNSNFNFIPVKNMYYRLNYD